MQIHEVFDGVATAFEVIGVLAMIVGFVVAFIVAGRRALQRDSSAFTVLRNALGGAILLGLEILVAADLIRTITSKPSLTDVGVLAIIVLLRTVLSMSIQIEVEGALPWRRALRSGATVMAQAGSAETDAKRAGSAS